MFRPGRNIAIKLPTRLYAATVAFYRDNLGLALTEQAGGTLTLDFGGKRLWLDHVPHQSQTDIWLEIETDDVEAAKAHLAAKGVSFCPEVEPLPEGFRGFWVAAPSGVIHLVSEGDDPPLA